MYDESKKLDLKKKKKKWAGSGIGRKQGGVAGLGEKKRGEGLDPLPSVLACLRFEFRSERVMKTVSLFNFKDFRFVVAFQNLCKLIISFICR